MTTDLQQCQYQRGELVAHGDACKHHAGLFAGAVNRKRRGTAILPVGMQGNFIGEAADIFQQAQ